jgi:hypothetical protein
MATPKKVGVPGKGIHSQTKEVIANVLKFMREEAEKGITIPLANFKQRLITATGISDKLYRKVVQEKRHVDATPGLIT